MRRVTGESNLADEYAWLCQAMEFSEESAIGTLTPVEPPLWSLGDALSNKENTLQLNRVPSVMRTESEYPCYIDRAPTAASTSDSFQVRWNAFLQNFFSEDGFRTKFNPDSPIPSFFKESHLICEICERISLSPSTLTYRGKAYSDMTLCRHCLFVGCLMSDGSGFSNFKFDEMKVRDDMAKESLVQALKDDESVDKSFLSTDMDYGEVDAPSKEKWSQLCAVFGCEKISLIASELGLENEDLVKLTESIGIDEGSTLATCETITVYDEFIPTTEEPTLTEPVGINQGSTLATNERITVYDESIPSTKEAALTRNQRLGKCPAKGWESDSEEDQ